MASRFCSSSLILVTLETLNERAVPCVCGLVECSKLNETLNGKVEECGKLCGEESAILAFAFVIMI